MNASDKKRAALVAVILVAAIAVVGYSSVSQSNYKPLSAILESDKRIKVTVEANTTSLGKGRLLLVIGDNQYTVEAHGSYGVARGPDGNVYAVFILESSGARAVAIYPVGDELMAYQTGSGLETSVVVSGVYDPGQKAVLVYPDGSSITLPVIFVDNILKGCHTSYEQGQASIG